MSRRTTEQKDSARTHRRDRRSQTGRSRFGRGTERDDSTRNRSGGVGQLHGIAGNQQVQRLVQADRIQRTLAGDDSDDRFEREAERVADAVVDGKHKLEVENDPSEAPLTREADEATASDITRASDNQPTTSPFVDDSLSSPSNTLQSNHWGGPGKPLADRVRLGFERSFGHLFGDVRIHDDPGAAKLNDTLGAEAFTYGQDIYFGRGNYRPETQQGRELLGHELTHVIQQRYNNRPTIQLQRRSTWESVRESAYSWLIENLRSLKSAGVSRLRQWAAQYSGTERDVADAIISLFDGIAEILLRLVLAVTGMVVGFGTGIVQMIVGLIQLIAGIVEGILLFLYGFIDGGQRFDEWAYDVRDQLERLLPALRALVGDWLTEFEQASEDRQTVMIGELTGQILALIGTFGFAAGRAGSIPRISASGGGTAQRMALSYAGGGSEAVGAAGITIDVASPAVAGVYSGALAMSIDPELADYLGEGPETSGMHETGLRGAGMARNPRHHVFPQEERAWFRERGFKGDRDIDEFTVELPESTHQALHGGGDWRLAREVWENEWNARIMRELREAEALKGSPLVYEEILEIGIRLMNEYGIGDRSFVHFRAPRSG